MRLNCQPTPSQVHVTFNMLQLDVPFEIASKFMVVMYHAGSEYGLKQAALFEANKSELEQLGCTVKIADSSLSIFQDVPKFKQDLPLWLIIDREGELLFHEINSEWDNLPNLAQQFLKNYTENTTGAKGYKWGNIIPEEGDYMCTDCGYILTVAHDGTELQPGDPFPIFEVCQAGTPDCPTGPDTIFWEKI